MSSFYGTGWAFPPSFDEKNGDVQMAADADDIQQSLRILLSTRPGERVMQPTYGCNLEELLFEPLTTTLKTYIKQLIQTAILYHEPRIKLNGVDLDESVDVEGLVLIKVDYTIRTNNSRYNFVYPYYKNERTG
jgi:hypothetical protein